MLFFDNNQFEISIYKVFSLLDLSKTQFFDNYKLAKIVIINKNKNPKFSAFQLVAPSLESLNYSQEFLIMNFVLGFC